MKAMFVNTVEERCGVHQYGLNLKSCVMHSNKIVWNYCECGGLDELYALNELWKPDAIVYNWQSGVGGYMTGAPFHNLPPQYLVYHDNPVDDTHWKGIIFSDPTMAPKPKWHSIGRPIPASPPRKLLPKMITIGVNGFIGAWADRVVEQVLKEFEYAQVRIRLPHAVYGDSDGGLAAASAARCVEMVKGTGIQVVVNHEFLSQPELLCWLAGNTMNCYFRDPAHVWTGVSSSLDSALAVRRPIAINRSNAFRHMHGAKPSICIEDNSLHEIYTAGLEPLIPYYEKWAPEVIAKQVDSVLLAL